jgi:predicted negative regulator of RcsB-dependent stress response
VSDHLSRKELKHDKFKETLEHGAEAVYSHTRVATVVLSALIVIAVAYFGWKFYSDNQTAQAQTQFDEAMKTYNAPLSAPGQPPVLPGEPSYSDPAQRSQDALSKLSAVAAKFPRTVPGKYARYYSALCMMDLDRLNQANEELKKLSGDSNQEVSALAKYQIALIAERTGKNDEAIKTLRSLSDAGSVLVPKPLVLLELAGIYRQTDPKQAVTIYEQIKKDYPSTSVADEADRGLESLTPKS